MLVCAPVAVVALVFLFGDPVPVVMGWGAGPALPSPTLLFWNRDFTALADIRPPDDTKDNTAPRLDVASIVAAVVPVIHGDELHADRHPIIYLMADQVPDFVKNVAPHILHPYVVVSGRADTAMGVAASGDLRWLDSPLLLTWWAQNLVVTHPKARALPIGFDFHTLEAKSTSWGRRTSAMQQANQLLALALEARTPGRRPRRNTFLLNFKISANPPARQGAWDALVNHPRAEKIPAGNPRSATWLTMAQVRFMICPEGNGVDTHRLWEAFALGAIPIISRYPASMLALLNGMPYVVVDSWSEVTPAALDKWAAELGPTMDAALPQQVMYPYWRDAILASAAIA